MRYLYSWLLPQYWQHMFFHLIGSKGLANVSASASCEGLHHVRLAAFGCDHYDGNAFGALHRRYLTDKFQTIHDRHIDIAEDEVDRVFAQYGQRFGAISGFKNLIQFDARLAQRTLYYLAHHRGVVHNERSYLIHGLSPLCGYWLPPRTIGFLFLGWLDVHPQFISSL